VILIEATQRAAGQGKAYKTCFSWFAVRSVVPNGHATQQHRRIQSTRSKILNWSAKLVPKKSLEL